MPECYVHQGESHTREEMQTHHVVPQAYGGGDDSENLVLICSSSHDLLHRVAHKIYANKSGEGKDIIARYLPDNPARQERLWKLAASVARARRDHARTTEIPEAGVEAEDQATVMVSLDVPDWLHHRLKTLSIGTGLAKYCLKVLENHALVATQKPGAEPRELFGGPATKPPTDAPNPHRFFLLDPAQK